MIRKQLYAGLVFLCLAALCGCSEPPVPPEVQLAESQELELWRAGAAAYAPQEYASYLAALQAARERLITERARFRWWRDDAAVQQEFASVLASGRNLATRIGLRQQQESDAAQTAIDRLSAWLRTFRELAGALPDTRLTSRRLSQTEVLLAEARAHAGRGDSARALQAAQAAETALAPAFVQLRQLLERYNDSGLLSAWRSEVETALRASRASGGALIVVSKLERRLTLYRGGREVKSYPVGMGFHYLARKLSAGDKATPEGSYRITHKNARSKFGLALLLDYPNAADRQRFAQARARGQLGAGARIGGLIEIHGGGTQGLTDGCIALDDDRMRDLFARVETGTPVLIVGALERSPVIVRALAALP